MNNLPMFHWRHMLLALSMTMGICTAQTATTQGPAGRAATSTRSVSRISPARDARQLPPGGKWTRKVKPNGTGETWTYGFTIPATDQRKMGGGSTKTPAVTTPLRETSQSPTSSGIGTAARLGVAPGVEARQAIASTAATQPRIPDPQPASSRSENSSAPKMGPLVQPPMGGIIQPRFVQNSDSRQSFADDAVGWYEFWSDAASISTQEVAALNPTSQRGWVKVDGRMVSLLRTRGIPYRRVMPGPLAGIPASAAGMSVEVGSTLVASHLAGSLPLATATNGQAGISAFDINFEGQPGSRPSSSVHFYLRLSHPHLDQINIWLKAGDREVVLWDGRGGSDDGGFDDDAVNDSNITLNRILTNELDGVPMNGHWTLCVSNSNPDAQGSLDEFWLTGSGAPIREGAGFSSIAPPAVATLDIIAQRAYLKTDTLGGGVEVPVPALGQVVFFTLDFQINGSGGPITFAQRALFDSSFFCGFSATLNPGGWISSCSNGWTVTAGTHTLEWDLDYTNVVGETNEGNNTAISVFTPTGLDVIGVRSYLKTASSGAGLEVSAPALGQTVFFTVDWQVAGAVNDVTVSDRALLDGSLFCSGAFSVGNGNWTQSCADGWTATAGSHTVEWDFDYNNQLLEINETNNSTTGVFNTAGVDAAALRAYLKTGPGSGIEVIAPVIGQTVYFTLDWTLSGAIGSLSVPVRAVLDGSTFCSASNVVPPGNRTTWCTAGWVATAGTHTIEWDLDYNNSIPETNESNNTAFITSTTSGPDLVAQRAYLKSAPGSGIEVTAPSVGQTVYFTVDWLLSGASGSLGVPLRAVLDGSTFCSFNAPEPSGSWTSWCVNGWVATAGPHTLEWDVNYDNSVQETNSGNDQASKAFTIAGADVVAQRAYLRTAAGSGTEVQTPTLGQTVFFTVDWLLVGATGTTNVPLRASLDGSTFCAFSVPEPAGNWTSWCLNGWVATGGTHSLVWDLNYNNSVVETNSGNNQVTDSVTIAGADLSAQRAYLRTAAGGGDEVPAPSLGQTVYFTADWAISGTAGATTVPLRAVLDGATFCADNPSLTAGSWTTWCVTGWQATAGSHSFEWDFDYTNTIPEVNKANNTAIDSFSTPAGSFSVSASPGSRTVTQGQTATYTVTVTSLNGFSGPVSLSTLNVPGNALLSQLSVTPPANGTAQSVLTIATNNQTATGLFPITVNGTNSGSTHSSNLNLTVNPVATPTITSTPASGPQGTVFTTAGSGFTPNGSVRVLFIAPGQTQILDTNPITASASGQISWARTTACTDATGSWSLWTRDVATNQESNRVAQLVTASSSCSAPVITAVSPASPVVNANSQSLAVYGSGFQTGLTVTAFLPNNGGSVTPQVQNVSTTGFQTTISLNVSGSWTLRVNNPDGKQSSLFSFNVVANSAPSVWVAVKNPFPLLGAGTALLLTDGSVMVHGMVVHGSGTSDWFRLTPDAGGSYVNGTWSQMPSMQAAAAYAPLYFSSAVMGNGRVVVIGGEYNGGSDIVDTALGSVYDPVDNSWAPLKPPDGWIHIGDAPNVVLPTGEFVLGNINDLQIAKIDPTSLDPANQKWKSLTSTNKADITSEEGWTLLPTGRFLTINAREPSGSQIYDPATGQWTDAGLTGTVNLVDLNSTELGPQVLRPNGTVIAFGASGHSAIFDSNTSKWANGPDFPTVQGKQLGVPDGPAVLLTNGNVLVGASPVTYFDSAQQKYAYPAPSLYFEFDGVNLNPVPNPPRAPQNAAYMTRMLLLPTGQVLFTDGSPDVEIYTPSGSPNPAWAPTITSAPTALQPGQTYTISGTQFNGLSQAVAYGDDAQAATNYPLVRITNTATGHVFYCRTHEHSTMGVATGTTTVSTKFDVPSIDSGPSNLVVVANGIPSAPWPVAIASGGADLGIAMARSGTFTQGRIGASYSIAVNNVGTSATAGTVTVSDTLPTGLTATNMGGTGWNCAQPSGPCTRADALSPAASYPVLTLTVNVAPDAPNNMINVAKVSGGGELNTSNDTATDSAAVPSQALPAWTVAISHAGNFIQSQTGATYSVSLGNGGAAASRTTGAVTVTEAIPAGLVLVSMYGPGWVCSGPTCTRSDSLDGGTSYPAITVIVNVAANAPPLLTNQVSVSGGGPVTANASDPTTITANPPVLSILKTHTGNFAQGQSAAIYTISVGNGAASGPTSGTVTVTETVPTGLAIVSMTGLGWTCSGNVCTRGDVLNPGSSYPVVTVTVNVASTAPTQVTNQASVTGGGSATAMANDPTSIAQGVNNISFSSAPSGAMILIDGSPNVTPFTAPLTTGPHTISAGSLFPGGAGTQYSFNGWADSVSTAVRTITVGSGQPVNYAANYQTQYQLNMIVVPSNGGSVNPASGVFFNAGSPIPLVVTLTAPGYGFSNWSGPGVTSATSAFSSVVLTGPTTVTATFSPIQACTYSLNPNSVNAPQSGGPGSFAVTTQANCGWTATSSDTTWLTVSQTTPSGTGSGTVSYSTTANNGSVRTASINVQGQSFSVSQAGASANPTAAVLPVSGGGSSQSFTFTFSDQNGYADIAGAGILVNSTLSGPNACYILFARPDIISLVDDSGTAAAGHVTSTSLGAPAVLQNSQCVVLASQTSEVGTGNTLQFILTIVFKSSFAGAKSVWANVNNVAGQTAGFQQLGSFNVTAQTQVLAATTVSPASGSGQAQAFIFSYTDPNGAPNISGGRVVFNSGFTLAGGCYLLFDAANNISLASDDGNSIVGTVKLGKQTAMQNSQCIVFPGNSYQTQIGQTLNLTVFVAFKAAFAGTKNIYSDVQNNAGTRSSFPQLGTYTVTASTQLGVNSVSPASATGPSQSFSFVYSDPNGYSDIASTQVIINPSSSVTNSCAITFNRAAGTLALTADGGSGSTSAVLGQATTLANSQCIVNAASSSQFGFGNYLTLTLFVTMKSSGSSNVYSSVTSNAPATVGPVQLGAWNVTSPSFMTPVSVSPFTGSAPAGTQRPFTFTLSNPAGASDISGALIVLYPSLQGASACYILWGHNNNLVSLASDDATTFSSATAGTPGLLSNSQCTVDTSQSFSVQTGNTVNLTVSVSFKSVYQQFAQLYSWVNVQNAAHQLSGWSPLSRFSVQ